MSTRSVLRVVAITLTVLATIGHPPASADEAKVEEFSGTGLRATSVDRVPEQVSDCGDTNPATSINAMTSRGSVTYTGFMEGTGEVLSQGLQDNCTGQIHNGFRVLDTFDHLTVAGRSGGAVVEIVGRGTAVGPGVVVNESRLRILCGTGELKGVHAEGLVVGSASPTGANSAFRMWVHFGRHLDTGFEFLCRDLDR
jgi:hypothetical protein